MDFSNISDMQLRESITQLQIRKLQIITLALVAGVVVFLGIVFYFMQNTYVDPTLFSHERREATKILLLVVILISVLQYTMSVFIVRGMLTTQRLQGLLDRPSIFNQQSSPADPVTLLFNIYRQMLIMRLAIYEGVALMGLVVLLFCAMNGSIQLYPLCWLSLAPSAILFIFAYIHYPTRDKVIFWIESNLLPKLRGLV